ncbi:hypothetical protein [Sediminibacterium ginsengisoli]|uniref:Uncharacterized protein n=1 Tax=Sediminibacterium ginsengisoli TaxID=413434 RepID=A0A1T4JPC2_9BACT|nr:hypothetical protein [Sediminibacterium ginsengisoli]SJZ32072.1 hypothetical protein SAMN04488132_10136 [Sediminibacterium ginsengisoli]
MEWIKLILPLLGVLFGWGLAESGKIFTDKKQDRRKLKKLLFLLLEIRNYLVNEYSIDKEIDIFLNQLSKKVKEKTGQEIDDAMGQIKPLILPVISKLKNEDSNVDFLEKSIDDVISELAEVIPLFAYELNGQHRIKERLKNADQYFTEFESYISQVPFDLKGWIQPKLTSELLTTLNENIIVIAGRIDRKTKKEVKALIDKTNDTSNPRLNAFLEEYILKEMEHIN